ncbi:MAG: hypothetical protein ACOYN0_11185, partial [Phycisphaerales bacterium]
MKTLCASPPRLISAVLLAVCAGAMPASGDIILNSLNVFHDNSFGWQDQISTWTSGNAHLSYGERWTPPWQEGNPALTYTQSRTQDRFEQHPVTGSISGVLMTSAYWNTTEPAGFDTYLIAGMSLRFNVTITTPGDYGMMWLVAGPGWPNGRAYFAPSSASEVAWIVQGTSMELDISPPAAP